jgi:predicted MPP superfamily phosphohydrolase
MRKISLVGIVVMLLVLGALEYYSYSAIKYAVKGVKPPLRNYILGFYIVLTVLWFASLFAFPYLRSPEANKTLRNFMISFTMGFLIMKLIVSLILFIDDIRRLLFYIIDKFYPDSTAPKLVQSGMTRSDFLNKFALLIGGTLFGGLVYGMTNRYNYRLKKHSINFNNLPSAFKGMRIIQISDIHSGSLNDLNAVQKGIDLIMAQKPDLIFFTGDLVNNISSEAKEFIPIFKQLNAPLGVYSILGNHDYGDYVEWDSIDAKKKNLDQLKQYHQQMGWRLLLNEHIVIDKEGQQIAVLGVENTSFRNRFKSYGSLEKAYQGSRDLPFKILLSHDPSHWDGEVNSAYKDIDLTLSGHTHGFQFGVDIPWLKWSPVQYIYKQWAGLYQEGEQYLYVNRGFGFLGYPGRVGIMPEITLLELI